MGVGCRRQRGHRKSHPRARSVPAGDPAAGISDDAQPACASWRLLVGHGADCRHAAGRPGSAWGTPGRYVYRYRIDNPNVGSLDWIIDPFAREFGNGKFSAFTLGYQPYAWSAARRTGERPRSPIWSVTKSTLPSSAGDFERTRDLMAYLADLGVNAIEVMPLSNVAVSVDWGYLPIGYFGVDERLGNRVRLPAAGRHGASAWHRRDRRCRVRPHRRRFPYYDAYTRLQYHDNPFMGPFAKDYFSSFGKSTDFKRQFTRDYFFTVNHHWLEVYHVDGFRYDCVPNYWDGPLAWATQPGL